MIGWGMILPSPIVKKVESAGKCKLVASTTALRQAALMVLAEGDMIRTTAAGVVSICVVALLLVISPTKAQVLVVPRPTMPEVGPQDGSRQQERPGTRQEGSMEIIRPQRLPDILPLPPMPTPGPVPNIGTHGPGGGRRD